MLVLQHRRQVSKQLLARLLHHKLLKDKLQTKPRTRNKTWDRMLIPAVVRSPVVNSPLSAHRRLLHRRQWRSLVKDKLLTPDLALSSLGGRQRMEAGRLKPQEHNSKHHVLRLLKHRELRGKCRGRERERSKVGDS